MAILAIPWVRLVRVHFSVSFFDGGFKSDLARQVRNRTGRRLGSPAFTTGRLQMMEVLHRRCAGLDVHQAQVTACVRVTPESGRGRRGAER